MPRVGLETTQGKFVSAVRAGEGYLAQSSKWLHFGLGEAVEVKRVVVRWPNGQREAFVGVTPNGRYTLVEGSGLAVRETPRNSPLAILAPSSDTGEAARTTTEIERIVLPARLPMPPELTYSDFDGRAVPLLHENASSPTLVNLWATWCQPCLAELADWSQHQQAYSSSGVQVLLLSVDEATGKPVDPATVQRLLQQLNVPSFTGGLATSDLLDALDVTQQVLTKRLRPMPVPTSFLIDGRGRLAVVYKGQADAAQVLQDIAKLSTTAAAHRDLAVPFPGSWYTNPFPPDLLAIPRTWQGLGRPELALRYLHQATDDRSLSMDGSLPPDSLANVYIELARDLQAQGKQDLVIAALHAATNLQPVDARPRLALAMIFQQTGRSAEAVSQYREVLSHNPGDPVVSNNLAWILATAASSDVRKPAEAIELAEMVTQKSRRKLPSALDTLAAAYAAAGRFEEAIVTIQEAIALQRSTGQDTGLGPMEVAFGTLSTKASLYGTLIENTRRNVVEEFKGCPLSAKRTLANHSK